VARGEYGRRYRYQGKRGRCYALRTARNKLPKKIDWGRQKNLALHAWLIFNLEEFLMPYSPFSSSS
jgi:hypothetical protein